MSTTSTRSRGGSADPRALLAVAGLVTLAIPPLVGGVGVLTGLILAAGVVALVAAVRVPGSSAPLAVLVAAVLAWLGHADPAPVATVCFAAGCYAVHSAAALAAGVPRGARVPAAVLRRWAGRALPAYGVGTVLAAGAVLLGGAPGSTGRTVAALLAAAGLLALPGIAAALGRR